MVKCKFLRVGLLVVASALALGSAAFFGCSQAGEPEHTHSYTAVVTPPSCTERGYTTYACECGDSYVDSYVDALGHNLTEHSGQEATCTQPGWSDYVVCSRCDYTTYTALPAKGHTPSAPVRENEVPASCTSEGSYDEVVYCSVCEAEISRTPHAIEITAHTPSAPVRENEVPASCTSEGSYDEVVYCSVCDTEISRTPHTVAKLAHTPSAPVRENKVPASCTREGSYDEVVYCSVCGTEINRTPHTFEKLAHTPSDPVRENETPASCSQAGSYDVTVYCFVCGTEISRTHKIIEKLPHSYVNGVCEVCGELKGLIAFKTLSFDGATAYGKVANAASAFAFADEIILADGASYTVCIDADCNLIVANKTVNLVEGDNVYYIRATDGEKTEIISVTIRRRPVYTVTLDTVGGSECDPIEIEEDGMLSAPAAPEKTGYTFLYWLRGEEIVSFPYRVTSDITFTAAYNANVYKVTFDTNGGQEMSENDVVYGESFIFGTPYREGYTFLGWMIDGEFVTDEYGKSLAEWSYAEDKTLTAQWSVNSYELYLGGMLTNYEISWDNAGEISGAGTYEYGSPVTICAEPYLGYDFVGWYDGEELLSASAEYTFAMPAWAGYTAHFKVRDDMLPFTFYSTATTCTLTGVKDGATTHVVIPAYVTELTLRGCANLTSVEFERGSNLQNLRYEAFYGCTALTSITIPGSVTSIGNSAFSGCSSLTSITIPGSVTSIGNSAFSGCSGLTSIIIPDGVKSIGKSAFYGCTSLKNITIPASVEMIGAFAFGYANEGYTSLRNVYITDLAAWVGIDFASGADSNPLNYASYLYVNGEVVEDIVIPEGVEEISACAFRGYKNLTSVTIPSSVTSIGGSAFADCVSLASVVFEEGSQLKSLDSVFYGCTSLKSITIPSSVTSLSATFRGCTALAEVTFEQDSQIKSMSGAFDGCTALESIAIPSSVTSIGSAVDGCFYGCTKLSAVYITDLSAWLAIDFDNHCNPLAYAHNLYLNGELVTELVIPEGTKTINGWAFRDCTSITSLTVPASVESIGDVAFYGCTNLAEVNFADGSRLKSIGESAFHSCSSLTEIKLPEGLTTIGLWAFEDCTSLTSITIPSSLTEIRSCAFDGCTKLSAVYITDLAAWCNISFGSPYGYPLYYAHNLYLNDELITELVIPEGVTSISNYAFYNCDAITSVSIPASVESIGEYAFCGCDKLVSVTFEEGSKLKSVGARAFYLCDAIKDLYIDDLKTFLAVDFGSPYSSSSRSYANPMYFADNIYVGGELMEELTIPEGTEKLGRRVFEGMTSLKSITIPSSVTAIGYAAFYDCTNLTAVYITDLSAWLNISFGGTAANPLEYAHNLYLNDELVTELVIPEGITEIGDYAFSGCTSITSVIIPEGVKSIGGYYTFSGCSNLTSISIPSSVTSIGYDNGVGTPFNGCTKLSAVYITDLSAWLAIDFGGDCNPLYYAHNLYLNGELVTELVIPEGIAEIGNYVFNGCASIISVTIPESVTSIGNNAFSWCSNLTSITIPSSVTDIGYNAFSWCTALTSITIPETVTKIGSDAFRGCNALTIYCEAANKPDGWHYSWNDDCPVVWDCNNNNADKDGYTYAVIDGLRYSLKDGAATVVGQPTTISGDIVIPSLVTYNGAIYSVTGIGRYAFYECTALTGITIPSSVTSIGRSAFSDCTSLTDITIPSNITSIGSYAFVRCDSLTSVVFTETNGWWYSSSDTATSGTNISGEEIADSSTAATYLTTTYSYCYWKRG